MTIKVQDLTPSPTLFVRDPWQKDRVVLINIAETLPL